MLRPAQQYKDELEIEYVKTWYDAANIYYTGSAGEYELSIPDNNYDRHSFASVDENGKVIGYISYNVDWSAMSVDNFGIISFDKGNLTFVKDLYEAIRDIFYKYHMNRMSWFCFSDNPALRGCRNFIKKHGGRECGFYREVARLKDGLLHDSVEFEIMANEFKE